MRYEPHITKGAATDHAVTWIDAWLDSVELVLDCRPLDAEALLRVVGIGRRLDAGEQSARTRTDDAGNNRAVLSVESEYAYRGPTTTVAFLADHPFLVAPLLAVASLARSRPEIMVNPILEVFTDPDEGTTQLTATFLVAGDAECALSFLAQVDSSVLLVAQDARVRTDLVVEAVPHG